MHRNKLFSTIIDEQIIELQEHYKEILDVTTIGASVQGIPIKAIQVGHGPKCLLIHATHHAREFITTLLVMDQIKYLIECYYKEAHLQGISIQELLKEVSFIFVPLVNPDGANLVVNGRHSVLPEYQTKYLLRTRAFPNWKANIRGVDLNRNYPTTYPPQNPPKLSGPKGYMGPYPFSEPETQALKELVEKVAFEGTISYHSSGQVIYWYYNQSQVERDLRIAEEVAQVTGYELVPYKEPALGAGFKDWFIEVYEKPSLTIEVSPYVGERPVPLKNYKGIWQRNKDVPIVFAKGIID